MKLRVVGAEAVRSIRASASTTFAATMTVLIGMFLLGLSIGLGTWVLSWSNHVKGEIPVKVYFCAGATQTCSREATPKQIDRVRVKLAGLQQEGLVKSYRFVSKEEALRIMRRKNPKLTSGLSYNPFPNAYDVKPVKGELARAIRDRLLVPKLGGIESVKDGGDTAKRILRVGKVVESVFLIGVVLLLLASTLLIANTIRLSIFARRREIEVMKLVGATNWFVRGPFMIEGLLCGLAGSLLAVVLLVLGKTIALPAILGHIDDHSAARALAFELNALIILGVGLLLGALGSGMTMRRFLRV